MAYLDNIELLLEFRNRWVGEIAQQKKEIAQFESLIREKQYAIDEISFVVKGITEMMEKEGFKEFCESCNI